MVSEGYSFINRKVIRKRFRALAGIVGVQWGIETANNDFDAGIDPAPLTFTPGRTDCASSPYTTETHLFPNGNGGTAETFGYFATTFGLSKPETVSSVSFTWC